MHRLLLSLAFTLFGFSAHSQTCDQSVNPHSFACQDDTFRGRVFPMRDMNGPVVAGPWTLFTYADITGRTGPEFEVLVNPQNLRIPEGVRNRFDGSMVGPLDWTIGNIRFFGWAARSQTLFEVQGHTKIMDRFTIQTILKSDRRMDAFQCRVFIRNNADHLLCRWQTRNGDHFVVRGYLGFLRSRR